MKKFKNLILSLVFVFSLVVLASCTIIDDTHIHCFEDGHCECGEIELEHIEKGVVKVTFLDEEGNLIETIEVVSGTLIPEVQDLEKEGCKFAGWFDGLVKWDFKKMPVSESITLQASFIDNAKYDIIYQLGGGNFEEGEIVETSYVSGIGLAKLPTPVRENYIFLGWYLNGELVDSISALKMGAVTLVAKWESINYEISYDLAGGEFYAGVKVPDNYEEGVGLAELPVAKRAYYIFDGWMLDGELVDKISKDQLGDVKLVAKWTPVEYSIAYDLAGGEYTEEPTLAYNVEEEVKLAPAKRVGYTFLGWYLNGELVEKIEVGTNGNLNLVAKWQVNEYTLTINVDGVKEEVVYDYNEAVVKPADPTKVGYTFTGWDKEVPANMPANDVEIVAKWEIIEYAISYDVDFKVVSSHEEIVDEFLKDYSDFAKTTITSPEQYWSNGSKTNFWKNAEMYAKWSWIFRYLIPVAQDQDQSTEYLENMLKDTPSISGYATQNVAIFLLKVNNDIWNEQYKAISGDLSSKYTTVDCTTVSFESYASYLPESLQPGVVSYTVEDEVTLLSARKTGYKFLGWYAGDELVETIQKGSTGNLTLKPKWEAIDYTITYELNGGEHVGEVVSSYNIENEVTLGIAEKEGYKFVGWYVGEELVETIEKGSTGNITLIAKWNAVDYRITYDADGGDVDPGILTYDQIATGFLADFNKYAGSSHTADVFASSSATSVKTALANAEMLAKWKWYFEFILEDLKSIHGENPRTEVSDTYKLLEQLINGDTTAIKQAGAPGPNGRTLIRYYTGGMLQKIKGSNGNATFTGFAADFSDVARQDALVIAANHNYYYNIEESKTLLTPTKAGYSFAGWYNGDVKVESIVEGTCGDITLKAHWSVVEYTISYNLSGGNHDATPTTKYTILDKVDLGTATRRGYQFLGWLLNGELVTEIKAGTTGNLELVASWEYQGVKSPINYELSEGEWPTDYEVPTTYDEGVGLDLSTVIPVRKGYTFAGWTLNGTQVTKISEEQIDAVTLTATWNINTYTITYVLNDGNEDHGNVTSYTIITDTIVLADATRSGYDFLGWFDGETKVESIEKGTIGNLTLTAKWEISSYTISYDLNGGEFIYSEYAENVEALKAFTLTNYKKFTSDGSQAALHTSTRVYWKHMALKETSLENVYEIVEFHSDAGTITLTSDYDLIVVWHENLADADSRAALNAMYNVQSSYLGDYVVFESIPTEATNSTVINAKVYDAKDLTIYEKADSYKPGSEFDLIAASKPGYTFVGWTTQSNEVITSITENQKGNLELTAKYEVNTYKITYDLVGGSFGPAYESREDMVDDFLKDAMTLYGITGNKPDGMVKGTGDTTIGFSNMFEASGIYNIFTDANYASKWAWLKAYVIEASTDSSTKSYLADGNNAYWRYSLGAFLFQEQRTSWPKSEDFTVNEKANGFWGTYVTKLVNSYTTGATVTLPEPTKDGVEFAGWYDGTKIIDNPATLTYGDIELTARWIEKYSIAFNSEDIKYYANRDALVQDFITDAKAWSGKTGSAVDMVSFATTFPAIYGFFSDATYGAKWSWLKAYILDATQESTELNGVNTKEQLLAGTEAFWRYSLGAFLFQEQRTTWPVSEDFTVDSSANGFWGVYATNINSYLSGSKMDLPTPTKEGYVFKGWVDQNSNIITEISESTYGNLTLTASWGKANMYIDNVPYETLSDALAAAKEGDTITLLAQNYNESIVITTSGITLTGVTVDGNISTLQSISINASNVKVENIKLTAIQAFEIKGGSNITIDGCQMGATPSANEQSVILISGAVNGFNLLNSTIIETSSRTHYRAIYSTVLVTNATITGNTFKQDCASSVYIDCIRLQKLAGTIDISNNKFDWAGANFTIFLGSSSVAANTTVNINHNEFSSANTASGIAVRNTNASTTVNVIGNSFDNVGGNVVQVRGSSSSDTTTATTVNMNNNAFNNTSSKLSFAISTSKLTVDGNYFYTSVNWSGGVVTGTATNNAASAEEALEGSK